MREPGTAHILCPMERMRELLLPGWAERGEEEKGYLDLLGERDAVGPSVGQRLMASRVLPRIYERYWRPFGVRMLMGVGGPGAEEEHRLAAEMLALEEGDMVLDVACGPGNFSRDFARAVGDGLVVGLDASATMLEVAVRDTAAENVAYVRGDACNLPFRDGSFDAVCCFAALYLIEEPQRAIREIARVLAPGGRAALMATCSRGPLPTGVENALVRPATGVRVFGREELSEGLRGCGLVDVERTVTGLAQFVSGRMPDEKTAVLP